MQYTDTHHQTNNRTNRTATFSDTIVPDQCGYSSGARPLEIDAYHVENLTQDILDIADSLELEKFHLVGHTHGGR